MKKLICFLSLLCMASVAFAEDGKFSVGAGATGVMTKYAQTGKDVKGDFADFQLAPELSWEKGGLKAFLALEYNAAFGEGVAAAPATNLDNGKAVGDTGTLDVTQAFVTADIAAVKGLSVKFGFAEYDFPLAFSDNAALAGFTYDAGTAVVGLHYIKVKEDDPSNKDDDSQIYALDAEIKAGPATVRPGLFIMEDKKGSGGTFADSMGYMGALAGTVDMGGMGADFAFAYATGKDKSGAADVEYSGYALDVAPFFQLNDDMKVMAFFEMASGDDGSKATEKKDFATANANYAAAGRMFILQDGGTFASNSDVAGGDKSGSTNGYMVFGAGFEGAFGPLSVVFQAGYGQLVKVASGAKKDLGFEADLHIGYEIGEESEIFVESAFLKTGEAFGASSTTQNANYFSLGMTQSL